VLDGVHDREMRLAREPTDHGGFANTPQYVFADGGANTRTVVRGQMVYPLDGQLGPTGPECQTLHSYINDAGSQEVAPLHCPSSITARDLHSRTWRLSMSKSPGHQKWPDHRVNERHLKERVKAEIAGEVVADSTDVILVEEDENPARYYFPRADVRMDKLERSALMTKCPFKGTANYYSVNTVGKKLEDAVWTYEDPFDEHHELKDRIAFYDDKLPEIAISPRPQV
jgi:uncharacterized protein (DUF427 family)